VLVGGAQPTVTRFLSLIPKAWQSLVRGSFAMDMDEPQDQVLRKAIEVAADDEREREERLVEAVITAAAKGKEGVVRLDDTLSEVHAGRVLTLIVRDGFSAPGYRCRGCGFLTSQGLAACPFCGKTFERIEDSVELAVRRVLEDGGEVAIVHESTRLEGAGSIGGLLRY
jgi:peptide subunit release factor 1 (eRF1)